MEKSEFAKACSLIRSFWPKTTFFENGDATNILFNALNRYDFRDTWKALTDLAETETFPPSIRQIVDAIEKAEKNRHDDERQNASRTWTEAVHCTKCNDSGFLFITYRKPAKDPSHCWPDDHPKYPGPYDYTEVTMPCDCETAREKFPWAFMDEMEWAKWVEDERRKGRSPSRYKPGQTREELERTCGEVYNIRPGRRPQVFTKEKG